MYLVDPKDFANDAVMANFCKIQQTSCIFPFFYNNKNHTSCLQREEDFWCATRVNPSNEPIQGFWGKCNVDEGKTDCDPNWTPPEADKKSDIKPMGKYLSNVYRV